MLMICEAVFRRTWDDETILPVPQTKTRKELYQWYADRVWEGYELQRLRFKFCYNTWVVLYREVARSYFPILSWPEMTDIEQHSACTTRTRSKIIPISWILIPGYDISRNSMYARCYCPKHRQHAQFAHTSSAEVPACRTIILFSI